jgi:heptaprenyl diphosphate synthase
MKRGHAMLKSVDLMNYFEEDLLEIKKTIKSNLESNVKNVSTLSKSFAAVEGKMVRAILVLIGGSFGKIEKNKLYNISAGIELLHLATLVHDDIIDESSLRRGKSTINTSYGIKPALFMGDYLFAESYVLFSKHTSPKSIENVSNTIKFVCTSEINQFFSTYKLDSTIKDYLRRINGKCASLFSLSLSIGALEGTADPHIIETLKKIGYYSGMAFQIIDDILDITSPKVVLGKPADNDIKEGIYTLPVLLELKNKNEALKETLENKNSTAAIEILKKSESIKRSKKVAEKYTYKAFKLIEELPDTKDTLALRYLIESLLTRRF